MFILAAKITLLFISTFAALTFVMRKEMQTLLDDIELDIQELKYLMKVLQQTPILH